MKEVNPENKGIHQVSQTPRSGKSPARNTGLSGEFAKILSEHLDPAAPGGSESSDGLPELSATYAAKLSQIGLSDTTGLAKQISQTIDLFERYAQGLADPDTTLKQAFDLLEQIDTQTRAVDQDMADTGNEDARLREITTHLSTLVAIEKIKINRGDYS